MGPVGLNYSRDLGRLKGTKTPFTGEGPAGGKAGFFLTHPLHWFWFWFWVRSCEVLVLVFLVDSAAQRLVRPVADKSCVVSER